MKKFAARPATGGGLLPVPPDPPIYPGRGELRSPDSYAAASASKAAAIPTYLRGEEMYKWF